MKEEDVKKQFTKVEKLLAIQKPTEALDLTIKVRKSLSKDQMWLLGKSYFWENLCYKHLQRDKESKEACKKGVKIFKEIGDFVEVSKILRDQGLSYEYLGDNKNALIKLEESLDILVKGESVDALGVTLSKIGQIYLVENDLENAQYYCELGNKICKLGGNKFFLLTSYLPLSLVYYYLGNHIAGLYLIEDAEKVEKELTKTKGYLNKRRNAEILLRKSLLLYGSNLYEESASTFSKFIKLAKSGEGNGEEYFSKQKAYIEIVELLKEKGLLNSVNLLSFE